MIVLTEEDKCQTPLHVDDEGDIYLHFNYENGQGITAVLNQKQFLCFLRQCEVLRGQL